LVSLHKLHINRSSSYRVARVLKIAAA